VSTLRVSTPEGLDLVAEVAGAGSRGAAAAIDGLILGGGWFLLGIAAVVVAEASGGAGAGLVPLALLVGGAVMLPGAYHALSQLGMGGRSVGKRAAGLRVVSADGFPARASQIVLRNLLYPVDILVGVPLMVLTGPGGSRRLGDLVAGTLVLREPRQDATREPFPNESWEGLTHRRLPLVPATAARFDEADFDFLRSLLARSGMDPGERRRLYLPVARHYAERLGVEKFDDAREVLRELYLYLRERRAERRGDL
jgi:uncharacterized RDD family membrane protein YckC